MVVVGPTLFTLFVWANVLLVLAVFAYELYVIVGERTDPSA
jgi:hypothetical protein